MKDCLFYIIAQLLGATLAIGILYFVLMGKSDFNYLFFSNELSMMYPNGSGLLETAAIEIILSAFLIFVFSIATEIKGRCACSSLMLGLTFTALYCLSIPFTKGSLNPARSFGAAIFEGGSSLQQVWFFFLMPMVGGILGTTVYKGLKRK